MSRINTVIRSNTISNMFKLTKDILKSKNKCTSEAIYLLMNAFSPPKTKETLMMVPDYQMTRDEVKKLKYIIKKRCENKPLSYITGKKLFWKDEFIVSENTLIPRPDTEIMIEAFKDLYSNIKKRNENLRILDLGTGSGCILLSCLKEAPNARGNGIDISEDAIKIANRNAIKLNYTERCHFKKQSFKEFFNDIENERLYDVVVCNPPYISKEKESQYVTKESKYEPEIALYANDNGMEHYKTLVHLLPKIISKPGYVLFEVGFQQMDQIKEIYSTNPNYNIYSTHLDLQGIPRVLVLSVLE